MPCPTYANVTSTFALFFALGGTSVAASNAISGSRIKAHFRQRRPPRPRAPSPTSRTARSGLGRILNVCTATHPF